MARKCTEKIAANFSICPACMNPIYPGTLIKVYHDGWYHKTPCHEAMMHAIQKKRELKQCLFSFAS